MLMLFRRFFAFGAIAILAACGGSHGAQTALPPTAATASSGNTASTFDIRKQAAEPTDVWVHYDYMVFPNGINYYCKTFPQSGIPCFPPGFSTAPDEQQIRRIVDAFRAQGLTLHIDPQHTAIPGRLVLVFDDGIGFYTFDPACTGGDAVGYEALKAKYFQPHSNHPWHYAIFGFNDQFPDQTVLAACSSAIHVTVEGLRAYLGWSGSSPIPGYEFIVTLGGLYTEQFSNSFIAQETAVGFMHELGHNFGLQHGGSDGINYKPNYLSVMNYADESKGGIPYAASQGSTQIAGFRLDYSERALPTLDENHLNENLGIQSGTTDISFYSVHDAPFSCGGTFAFVSVPTTGPIDWNCDGTLESDVSVNLHSTPGDPQSNTQLVGFDDWSFIKQSLTVAPAAAPRAVPHVDTMPVHMSPRQFIRGVRR